MELCPFLLSFDAIDSQFVNEQVCPILVHQTATKMLAASAL